MRRLIFLLLVLVAVAPHPAKPESVSDGMSLFNLTGTWTRADGQRETFEQALATHPAVVAMIYTGCSSLCPLIVERMRAIEDALPPQTRGSVRFVLFSIDSEHDTPATLAAFAGKRGVDASRWGLYCADARTVRQLALALGVSYRGEPDGSFDHFNLISLVDRGGVLRYQDTGSAGPAGPIADRLAELVR